MILLCVFLQYGTLWPPHPHLQQAQNLITYDGFGRTFPGMEMSMFMSSFQHDRPRKMTTEARDAISSVAKSKFPPSPENFNFSASAQAVQRDRAPMSSAILDSKEQMAILTTVGVEPEGLPFLPTRTSFPKQTLPPLFSKRPSLRGSVKKAVSEDREPWSMFMMHCIMYVGMVIFAPCVWMTFGYTDVVPNSNDSGTQETTSDEHTNNLPRVESSGSEVNESSGSNTSTNGMNSDSVGNDDSNHVVQSVNRNNRANVKDKMTAWIPYIVGVSDFITCIGAGMTVKFFNLFFIEEYHFSTADIAFVQIGYAFTIAAFTWLLGQIAKRIGRAQTSFLSFLSNGLMLFLMARLDSLPLLLSLFMVRGGLANGTGPLDRSIQMDYTPSKNRGKWNALQSLNSLTWSGNINLIYQQCLPIYIRY